MLFRLLPASVLIATFTGSLIAEQTRAADRPAGVAATGKVQEAVLSAGGKVTAAPKVDLDPRQRTARAPYPKVATDRLHLPIDRVRNEVSTTGRIIVKLRDDLGARAPRQAAADRISSFIGEDLSSFDAVLAEFGGTVQQWITNKSDETLRTIELRAEAQTGRGQPDFASFMVVNVAPNVLLQAGRALNNLDIVEFVEFERPLETHQDANRTCDPGNQTICNAPSPNCPDPPTNCNPDPGCAMEICESGCADVVCCQLVGDVVPYCDDPDQPQGWDLLCAAYANLLCDQTIYDNFGSLPPDQRYDPCFTDGTGAPNPIFLGISSAISGGCFEAHDSRGCDLPACCFAVCGVDPTCCTVVWDASCVALTTSPALEAACTADADPGPTPIFSSDIIENPLAGPGEPPFVTTNWQAYTQVWPVISDFTDFPPTGLDPAQVYWQSGWRGGGFDLEGIRALQQQFATIYQGDIQPNLNGRTVRVGIVEFSAFWNHEDFRLDENGDPLPIPGVILESGQTPILINGGANDPEHGTATLGITVARDNGFGVTGIAHEAQGYFFPTLSVEEGSRLPNAILSAMEIFEPGDVLNFSIGFPGAGPIVTSEAVAALILSATDLGISCIMSAGNDSIPIEPAPFETNAVIVGACFPGGNGPLFGCAFPGVYHYCRLGFSNYTGDDDEGLGTVHLSGWGTSVMTTGYADFFKGENPPLVNPLEEDHLRTYTNQFNGTSAAAPVVAGLAAVLQGWAKQIYGTAITPAQLRGVLSGNGNGDQCWPLDPITLGPGPDMPDCNDDVFRRIGTFPDALACAFAIMTGQFVDGNATTVKILYGNPVGNASTFQIRNADGNYMKIQTKYAAAGTTVQQLAYMGGGPTTDVMASLQTNAVPGQLTGVALTEQGRATASNVLLGGFLWNNIDGRWDFIGVGFLTPGGGGATLGINPLLADRYVNSSGGVTGRIWTVGLGATPPHQVWHDLIQITAIGPTLPAP
ncbi:MAG: S8 family serine peptidase [Phycisphaerae bacterium]|nr:S8 family serine peptidase [Phycisphaerae bacterium]